MSTKTRSFIDTLVTQYASRVAEPQRDVSKAQKNAIRGRYEWGTSVANALAEARKGDRVAQKVAEKIGKSTSYVRQHAQFAREVREAFDEDDPIAAYLRNCDIEGRKLTWKAALRWMRDSDNDETDVDPLVSDVERAMQTLEDAADRLAQEYLEGEVPEDVKESVEGVITRAKQMLTEEGRVLRKLTGRERTESEVYKEYIRSKSCIACGHSRNTVPHHLERGGHGTKGSDHLTVPLCQDCHQRLHDVPEQAFWRHADAQPYKEAALLQSAFLDEVAT